MTACILERVNNGAIKEENLELNMSAGFTYLIARMSSKLPAMMLKLRSKAQSENPKRNWGVMPLSGIFKVTKKEPWPAGLANSLTQEKCNGQGSFIIKQKNRNQNEINAF